MSAIISFHSLGKVTTGTEHAHPLSVGITAARNTTPGWLLQLVGDVFAKSNVDLVVPGLWRQAADRAMALAQGDQVAGLTRGIPSLRLYDDEPGNPSVEGLAFHGPALERLVLSLDGGAELPGDPGTALLLNSGRYLTNGSVALLAVLCLLPTLAALVIWLIAARISLLVIFRHLRDLALVGPAVPPVAPYGLLPGVGRSHPSLQFPGPHGRSGDTASRRTDPHPV